MQSCRQKVSYFVFAASFAVLSIIAVTFPNQKAFGDGLTAETFSATLGDRNAELLSTSKSSHTYRCKQK